MNKESLFSSISLVMVGSILGIFHLLSPCDAYAAPPIANAGGPYIVSEEAFFAGLWTVKFDGTGSTGDEGIVRYEWDFGDGTTVTAWDGNERYNFFESGIRLYGYDVPDANLRVIATQDNTNVEIVNLQTGNVVNFTTLDKYQQWSNVGPGDGVYFKLEADKPVVAYETDMDWGHSTFVPSLDAGPVGHEFIFYYFASQGFYVFAVEDTTVRAYRTDGSLAAERTMTAGSYWNPGLSNGVYHFVSSGRIAMQNVGGNAYTTVPSTTGSAVGRTFYCATYGWLTGTLLVFAYEDAAVSVYDMDSGDLIWTRNITQGDYWWRTDAGTRRLKIESTGDVEVWAGDTEGGYDIASLGDGISFAGGRDGREFYVHGLRDGLVIFAAFDNTDVSIDGSPQTLKADDYVHLPGGALYHIIASKPILIQSLGRANWYNDEGTYLGGVSELNRKYNTAGTYPLTLTVYDSLGQSATDNTFVEVRRGDPPQAEIVAPDHFDLGIEGTFSGSLSSDDYGISAYHWDFGDGTSAEGETVYHYYSSVGTYTVTLTVYDRVGQSDIVTKAIEVSGENLVVCVPWQIIGSVEVPHDTWSGNEAVLKAVAKSAAVPIDYTWDFGDGTSESGTITNASGRFAVEARHVYTGSVGEPFIATITITDATGVTAHDTYPLTIRKKTLEIEENVAIDSGLWWLHKNQIRGTWSAGTYGDAPVEYSYWSSYGSYYASPTASAVQAFLINGHLETGDPIEDPYVETVRRGMRYVFTRLNHINIGPQTYGDPDTNGNGIGLQVSEGYPIYQGGMVMDAIAATGTPDAVTYTGGANVRGRTYRDILTDMVDMYAWGQYDDATYGGGWRYNWNEWPDNSAAQWGAIGLLAAEEVFGLDIPQWVKDRNNVWLNYSFDGSRFGYTSPGYCNSSCIATTPSGMIELAFCDKTTSDSRWRTAEDWIANNWAWWRNQNNVYAYYAFAKAMRQAQPVEVVNLGATGLDWFGNETDGLARYIINRQQADLGWPDYYGRTFAAAWQVIILTRTLFVKPPVAIVHASPNPGAVGQDILFDASASYHLDPFRSIAAYQWDFDASDGLDWDYPDATGPIVTHTYGALGDYTATLRVLDDNVPQRMDTDVVVIHITIPPHPPTAVAGGPYIAAVGEPITLDGSGSYDIDASEGDSITAYGWEIDMISPRDYDDATGVTPTIPGFGAAGTYPIGLRVTDDTENVFPESGSPNLTDDDFTEVIVYDQCITDLYVRPKATKASLVWTHIGADEYEVYRSTAGPNIGMELIGTTDSTYSTFLDYNVELNIDYWYRVTVEDESGICSSYAFHIRSGGRIRNRPPQITSTPLEIAQEGQLYAYDVEAQDPDGDTITFILDQAPDGMTIDEATGIIEWVPVYEQVGPNDVTVRAEDSRGASATQFFTVVVTPRPNEAPVSNPNGPYTALRGELVSFDGSSSYDPENDLPLTYQWSFGDGETSDEQNPTHVYTASGLFVVTLFVTDSRGATGSAETTAQIDEPNRIPTAEVVDGPAFAVRLGEELILDGSPSYDPDGDPLTYQWNWGDSTEPDTGETASHTYTSEDIFNGSLTVDDGRGGQDTYGFIVAVYPPNNPPVAVFDITEMGVNVGDQFTFDASATQDPDGDPMSYDWDFGDDSTTTGIIVTHVFGTPGDFTVTLTVRDDHQGEDSASELIHINAPPQIITTSLPDATEDVLYTVGIEATDADDDTLAFNLPTAPVGMTIDSVTGQIQWVPQGYQGGLNSLTVVVDDGHGQIVSQDYTIMVNLVNDAPVITSSPPTSGEEGILYTYQVQAADEDDTDLTFSLDILPDGMTIVADTGRITWSPSAVQAGLHPVTVRVTDPAGAFGIQDYTIEVAEALNAPPVVTSTPVVIGAEGQPYVYDIEVYDPDGDPVTFSLITAPDGMIIDATTGLIEWFPAADQSGTHDVLVQIDDGRGGVIEHGFTITVEELLNLPPEIVSDPNLTAAVASTYTYQVEATDPDEDTLLYSLTTAPDGMDIDPITGMITWTPTESQQGDNGVVIQVEDGRGGTATQPYILFVRPENQSPVITSMPVTTGIESQLYTYDVEAEDPEGDPIEFGLVTFPGGMSIDASTGLINWTPQSTEVGDFPVEVQVIDHLGGEARQPYILTIADGTPPTVTVEVDPDRVDLGETVVITVTATDNVGVVGMTLTVNGISVPLIGNQAIYTTDTIGLNAAEATATDDAGLLGTGSATFVVIDPDDTEPPVVSISSPVDGEEITAPRDVIGTADDPGLESYELEFVRKDTTDWTLLATGTTPIIEDVIGQFDPTMLVNGLYEIRLSASDFGGNTASAAVTCLISGNLKVGINTMTFTDLQVPVCGIDITINRKYDSRVKTREDFGVGWSVEILDVELRENCIMGDGWYAVDIGWPYPDWELRPSKVHIVVVTYPDGRTDVFDMEASLYDSSKPTGFASANFVPRSGTTSTLVPLGSNILIYQGGELLDSTTGNLFDPNRYLLTTKDGRELVIDQSTGLESIEDTNGNILYIDSSGIVHSSDKSVFFIRDAEDRITQIIDPMGNTITYTYDANGDLIHVTPRTGDVITYTYDDNHNLLEIINPLGEYPLRAEYDSEGRLIATRDAEGNRIALDHDLENLQSVLTDRLGHTTIYRYDERGNIVNETDALGNTAAYTYDAQDNLLSQTDPLGNTITYTYDSQDNLLTITDPLENVTSYTYNSRGQVLTTTDSLGNTTTNTYDASGNLLTTTDPLGNVWSYAYDGSGNRTQETDPAGNTTTCEYSSFGRLTRETTPCGGETRHTYNANGYRTQQIVTRTTSSGTEEIIMQYQYDVEGRQIRTIYADGSSTKDEYDAAGNIQASVDVLGRRTTYIYTLTGLLSQTSYPDDSTEEQIYDAEGRLVTSTDQNGNTTTHVYDALGREIQIVYPDDSSTSTEYDAAGRTVSETDERGNTSTYAYDAAGQRTSTTNALSETTSYTYDAVGNLISTLLPNGQSVTYEYDANGRNTKTIYPDEIFKESTYDFRGRVTSETDQAGLTTTYNYDACGRLIAVIDALGQTTAYSYDELGNWLSQTDANGNTTTWEYDSFGRVTRRILPLGMSETISYNAIGARIAKTDFGGSTTTYTHDSMDRLVSKTYPDGSSVSFTYTPTGQRASVTDSRGVTTYTYDVRDRLIQRTDPDGIVISYTYDAAGNRTSVTTPSGTTTYTYDELNRLQTVTDPDGGATTHTYASLGCCDSVGNLLSVAYPNGTVTRYTYDDLGRLTYLDNRRSDLSLISSYTYTLGPSGNRLRIVEDTGRTVDYAYDNLYRLIEEDITDAVLGDQTISYDYDSVGNRLTRIDTIGGTTNYTYDANDRLLSAGSIAYAYDNNGNTLSKIDGVDVTDYTYDYENRLISAQTPSSVIDYAYDADGIRVSSTVDGADTKYLVDKNRDYAQILEERDGGGSLVASYVYGDDLISRQEDTDLTCYHYDGQGSVRQLTEESQAATDSYTYDGFGLLLDHDGTSSNPYLYVGEQFDPNLEQYYLRARYYGPELGRFLTMDPVSAVPSEPLSLHRYVYGWNDPINRVDPSGLFTYTESLVVVTIVGILAEVALPGCNRKAGNKLFVDFYYWNKNVNEEGVPKVFWGKIGAIKRNAMSVVKKYFRKYKVDVVLGADTSELTYKTMRVGGSYEPIACWMKRVIEGDAPRNGNLGRVYLVDIMVNLSTCHKVKDANLVGIELGNTITHEAGHLYGIKHPGKPGNIMHWASIKPITSSLTWCSTSHKRLKKVLGLRK